MKKTIFLLMLVGFLSVEFVRITVINAQTVETEYQKKINRDKSIPKEKVDKAFEEARNIQDNILAIITKKKPKLKLLKKSSRQLRYDNPGERGTTHDGLTWQSSKTNLFVDVILGLKKESELITFRKNLESISIGDVYEMSNIGDEAVLIKYITVNKINTEVSMRFIKGRVRVNLYVNDQTRTTKQNEKELMEIVRLIEPLIIARDNFEDGF